MPAATLTRTELHQRLADIFRQRGYDGASIADIAEATGLGKSSLYHYFPGGKEEMAAGVLAHLAGDLEAKLFAPMEAAGTPARKLGQMIDTLDAFYDGGRRACLLERLTASADRQRFQRPLAAIFLRWLGAVERLCRDAGLSPATSRVRAEEALTRLQGSLVLAAGTGDPAPFQRALAWIRKSLLAG
jgi:AcrR family transcriptional regulator